MPPPRDRPAVRGQIHWPTRYGSVLHDNSKPVEVMPNRGARTPKTVRPDQLISESLEMLNSTKVTALFAVEGGKPVGIIHVHDLLRAGVA